MATDSMKRWCVSRTWSLGLFLLVALPVGWCVASAAGDSQIVPSASAGPSARVVTDSDQSDSVKTSAPRQPKDPMSYGLWVLLPAAVAILLAIFTRQVVPAVVVGILTGGFMMLPCLPNIDPYAQGYAIVDGFRLAVERYVIGAILDPADGNGHLKIMIFTLVIGFMVGVIGRNGGTAGMVKLVAGDTESKRRGALTAWFAGLIVFFDDYANTMIVGPTMRSVFDRLKISRAKLAYIVDSTAAPVASLALIGTWVGAEVSYIQDGLTEIAGQAAAAPAFMLQDNGQMMTGMQAFIQSLPYRFYPILALVLVFWIALTGRDFGPMKRAEGLALSDMEERPYEATSVPFGEEESAPRWWLGILPILILLGGTIAVLISTGVDPDKAIAGDSWWEKAGTVVGNADSYLSILYGALLAAVAAVMLTLLARACSTKKAIDAGLDGMARMFPAIVILVLAWALSQIEQDLKLGVIVADQLRAAGFELRWMPIAVFLAAAGISFATGSSWTTMGILCPVTVTLSAGMAASLTGVEAEHATQLFYAAVGAVLAGSIFGDHCSPISDTTVLSSIAAGCRHEDHVWTQLPYALVTAIVAVGLGDLMCSYLHLPWYVGIAAGAALLLLIVLVVGRRAKPAEGNVSAMP